MADVSNKGDLFSPGRLYVGCFDKVNLVNSLGK